MSNRKELLFVLVPIMSVLYTFLAREFAGPSYTTAPNQEAMFVFLMACLLWVAIALVASVVIQFTLKPKNKYSKHIAILCLVVSWLMPFVIGMK